LLIEVLLIEVLLIEVLLIVVYRRRIDPTRNSMFSAACLSVLDSRKAEDQGSTTGRYLLGMDTEFRAY